MRMSTLGRFAVASLAWMAGTVLAADSGPVIAEGIVPDEATRAGIIQRLYAIYGSERVMDRMEVADVTAPAYWSRYALQAMTDELKNVTAGELRIEGNAVHLRGKVTDEQARNHIRTQLKAAFNATYAVHDELTVDDTGARQQVLDQTLASRTVRFESGSAVLTPEGRGVLDDMAAAIVRVGIPQLDIVGHTDSVGDRQTNILLSVQRADAVKAYLARQGIDAQHMIVSGRGPDLPVADNSTAAGRARNRRIEFVIRRS